MRNFVAVGALVALLAFSGVAFVTMNEDREAEEFSYLVNADPRLIEALTVFERGDVALAVQLLNVIAEAGDTFAELFLGALYLQGFGVAEDHCRALELFKRAAAKGNVDGMVGVGQAYHYAHCVPVDFDEAERYYKQAAALGFSFGYLGLASLHNNEEWESSDPSLIREMAIAGWDAIDQKHNYMAASAADILGMYYQIGIGGAPNLDEAEHYYRYAAEQGLANAQYNFGMLFVLNGSTTGLNWIFAAAEQGEERAVAFRDEYDHLYEASFIGQYHRAARTQLWRLSNRESLFGDAAEWCRQNRPEAFECLRFAIADRNKCTPQMTQEYITARYIRSEAYDACRREAVTTRE